MRLSFLFSSSSSPNLMKHGLEVRRSRPRRFDHGAFSRLPLKARRSEIEDAGGNQRVCGAVRLGRHDPRKALRPERNQSSNFFQESFAAALSAVACCRSLVEAVLEGQVSVAVDVEEQCGHPGR